VLQVTASAVLPDECGLYICIAAHDSNTFSMTVLTYMPHHGVEHTT